MQNRIQNWSRRLWGLIVGLGVVIALLVGIFDFSRAYKEWRATPTPSATTVPSSTPMPTISPTSTSGPFQFIELPDQAKAGNDVKVVVQAWQGASCHLDYLTPDGNPSQAQGLGIAVPDSQAKCTWEWHIQASTLPGMGKLVISINDIKETHDIEILPGS